MWSQDFFTFRILEDNFIRIWTNHSNPEFKSSTCLIQIVYIDLLQYYKLACIFCLFLHHLMLLPSDNFLLVSIYSLLGLLYFYQLCIITYTILIVLTIYWHIFNMHFQITFLVKTMCTNLLTFINFLSIIIL